MAKAGGSCMTKVKTYTNPTDFRRALETRLSTLSRKEGTDIQKLRRQLAFDRLLARLFQAGKSVPWALKGGYAMELRVQSARTTKDIDLAIRDSKLLSTDADVQNQAIREELQKYAKMDLGDHFVFEVGEPIMDIDAAPYGGGRFAVEAKMDKRLFIRFHLDVGVGDVWMEPLESVQTRDWLAFASVPSSPVLAVPKEQQFAEKIHAYTVPRPDRQNSRVKDLVDLVLLIQSKSMDSKKVTDAIKATFSRRKTHEVPDALQAPPESWENPFAQMAKECGIRESLAESFQLVAAYLARES